MMGSFPRRSETFITRQIAGVIASGHDVDIFAIARSTSEGADSLVDEYRMMDRIKQLQVPSTLFERLGLIARHGVEVGLWRRPKLLGRLVALPARGSETHNLSTLYNALSFMRQAPYDVVHCQFGGVGLRALLLKRAGIITGRLVVSFRGADLTKALRQDPRVYDDLFREADFFLPVSDALKQRLLAAGCPEDKIEVIYSGIDPDRFAFQPRELVPGEPVKLLSIGRLAPKKGFGYAIEAVGELVRSGYDVSYTIVGDGDLKKDLEELIKKHALTTRVHLAGWQTGPELAAHLAVAHVFLAPSVTADDGDEEGIPNVLKEAMAAGLPVVGTVHGGIPELVENGVTGLLAPERDVEALADCLVQLIACADQWQAMGAAGRAKVESAFDSTALTHRLVASYERLLSVQ